MPGTLLRTKLYGPPLRPNLVARPRLIERLNQGLHPGHKLTLVSAPAGFGKSTLVSEWVAGAGRPVAWLSLDGGDNDLIRFLGYVIAALQTIEANIGAEVLKAIQSPQPPPIELMLAELLNEITLLRSAFFLVLDDYYVIDAEPVNSALAFLIEHLPQHMHMVVASREDPPLPLARYRARGQLTEVRADDLRFTLVEAGEFLNQVMDLDLSPEEYAALESRTEGWIVGLKLAALSMQGLQDTAGFIQSFTGSHHFVLDYLLEEVLHKQPEEIQGFLLRASILERMCGPLCDAVTLSPAAGQEILEYLERANLFMVPLDNERRWYRFHHLFADLLRNRLERAMPAIVPELHRRASDWYARNDFPNEGISHALAGQDWTRAAEIIEQYSDQWPMRGEVGTLLRWLESFPDRILRERPSLGLAYTWALYLASQFERAERHLRLMTPLVQPIPSLLGEVFVIRVMIAANRRDLPAVIELAQQAMTQVPPEEISPRSRILLSLGVTYDEMGGDIATAKSAFREAYELSSAFAPGVMVGNAPLSLTALAYLAEIEFRLGNLRAASRMYDQALELVGQWGSQSSIAHYLVEWGRAGLLYESNDLDGAASALQESIRIGELWKNPGFLVKSYGLLALVMQASGQPHDAQAIIHRAEEITRESHLLPSIFGALAACQIALWTMQNDFQAIALWEQGHDTEWRLQTGRARNSLTIALARASISRYYRQRDDSALRRARVLIEPALAQAQSSGVMLDVTRLLILDGLALYAQRENASALATLKRALALAELEDYVRSFLDMGSPMERFLSWGLDSQSLDDARLRAYARKLLSHLGVDTSHTAGRPTGEALIEPLTQRELEVLRLIAQGLSNREIGARLFLALSTVKGHVRNIFDKFQVQRRTEAVARARDLGLL